MTYVDRSEPDAQECAREDHDDRLAATQGAMRSGFYRWGETTAFLLHTPQWWHVFQLGERMALLVHGCFASKERINASETVVGLVTSLAELHVLLLEKPSNAIGAQLAFDAIEAAIEDVDRETVSYARARRSVQFAQLPGGAK